MFQPALGKKFEKFFFSVGNGLRMQYAKLFFVLGLCIASALAVERHIRSGPQDHEGFQRLHRADPRKTIPFGLSLKQKNLDVLHVRVWKPPLWGSLASFFISGSFG